MHDVGVDFGGLDVCVAHEFLDHADVDAVFQQVGGKGVPQGMAGGPFGDAGPVHGGFHGLLQAGLQYMMPAQDAGSRILAQVLCGEQILPPKLRCGVSVFAGDRFREIDTSEPL